METVRSEPNNNCWGLYDDMEPTSRHSRATSNGSASKENAQDLPLSRIPLSLAKSYRKEHATAVDGGVGLTMAEQRGRSVSFSMDRFVLSFISLISFSLFFLHLKPLRTFLNSPAIRTLQSDSWRKKAAFRYAHKFHHFLRNDRVIKIATFPLKLRVVSSFNFMRSANRSKKR